MDDQFKLFKHPKFGEIRVILPGGNPFNPLFSAGDACRALEIKNSRDALKRLDDDEKMSIIIPNVSWTNGVTNSVGSTDGSNDATSGWIENRMNFVNEPGLYRLIFSSRKKEAREFQRWVYHEVLPSIRKTGGYSVITATAPVVEPAPAVAAPAPVVAKPAKTKNINRVAGQLTPAHLYVAHKTDNLHIVKIGQSNDPKSRLPKIKGLNRKDFYKTVLFPRKVARLFEQVCHEIFEPYALGNELFDIEYDEACRIIKALEKFTIGLSKIYNFEHDDKALAIAKKLLVEAANVIADKN